MALLKIVNGLPTAVQAQDASTYLATGLSVGVNLTLPGSITTEDTNTEDILVIVNDQIKEITRDYTKVSSTQIQFTYTLPYHSVVRVKKYL